MFILNKDEISNKTNLKILKGDYFFSLGYLNVCQLGNPLIVKLYSKISENFAKSIFNLDQKDKDIIETSDTNVFFEKLVERFVGFIYYGCKYGFN